MKFLNFREAYDRLNRHLLKDTPLRTAKGLDSGVRLLDIDNDGYIDVLLGSMARLWKPQTKQWQEVSGLMAKRAPDAQARQTYAGIEFGIVDSNGKAAVIQPRGPVPMKDVLRRTDVALSELSTTGLELNGAPVIASVNGVDQGVRLRDIDRDGICELIVSNPKQNAIFQWDSSEKRWKKLPYSFPAGTMIVDAEGHDAGLRFVDVNGDGYDDVLFSNPERSSLHLFIPKPNQLGWKVGWNDEIVSAARKGKGGIPMIVRGGAHPDNGVWFKDQTMWIQNEDTASLPDQVDRRTFKQLLELGQARPLAPQDALKSIRVRPGFTVELVASEPLVQDPSP